MQAAQIRTHIIDELQRTRSLRKTTASFVENLDQEMNFGLDVLGVLSGHINCAVVQTRQQAIYVIIVYERLGVKHNSVAFE